MIEVEEINDIDSLAAYRHEWNDLISKTAGASFFQTLDWLEAYWKHFGAGQRLRVLRVLGEGRLLGIIPLVVRTEKSRVGAIRVLTYPLHDWGTFYGPIGPNPTVTLLAGLRHVRTSRRNWDLLDLRWIDLEDADRGRTERTMVDAGFRPHQQAWDRTALIELQGDWMAYWRSRDAKFRKNIDRCELRLQEHGEVTLERYRPEPIEAGGGDPRLDLYDTCLDIAERSWQASVDDGTTLCHGSVREFLRDAHLAAARRGMFDLNLLNLNGRPIAFTYNYYCRGSVYGLRKGFDPEFAALRPGLVMQKLMLVDGCRRGDFRYDLGAGSAGIKEHWKTRSVFSHRFTHFPMLTVRAQLLRLNRWLRRRRLGDHDVACAESQGV